MKGISRVQDVITFHAKSTNTTPTGSRLIKRRKPASSVPGTSWPRTSSAILFRYSPLLTAVVISFAVYAIGLPICCVSSFANSSCFSLSSCSAFVTIFCRLLSVGQDFRYAAKAFWAIEGSFAISSGEAALRITIGWFVEGEIVVKVSLDMSLVGSMRRNLGIRSMEG